MSTVFILAPLGDPWGYDEVEYRLPTEKGEAKRRSRTSIAALVEAARQLEGEPIVMAIVQESLLAPPPRGSRDYQLLAPGCARDYRRLVRGMLGAVRRLLQKDLTDVEGLLVENAPSAGLYGVGKTGYKARWVIAGDLGVDMYSHYYSIALLKILRAILTHYHSGGSLELWVDTTHGINYAGTAFLRATIQAARILAAALGTVVELRQYNSEPYIRGVTTTLNVHLVRRETITPKRAASSLVYTLAQLDPNNLASTWGRAVETSLANLKKTIRERIAGATGWLYKQNLAILAAAGAFFGAPLLLLQAGRWAREQTGKDRARSLLSIVETILGLTDPLQAKDPYPLSIETRDGETLVGYTIAPHRARLTSLLAGAALALYAANAYETLCSEDCAPPPGARTVPQGVCAPLATLKQAKDQYIAGPVWRLVEQELSLIEKSRHQPRGTESLYMNTHLALKQGACSQPQSRNTPQADPRIFQAHAGLPSTITGACPTPKGEPCLYYIEGSEDGLTSAARKLLVNLYEALHKPQ